MSNSFSSRIAERLRTASPALLQQIAEDFVQIEYSTRFPTVLPFGRNMAGQTIKGWPDAGSGGIGTTHGLEVTGARAWEPHLEQDLAKAATLGVPLTSFVFVAAHPGAKCNITQLAAWNDRFRILGPQFQRLDLLVGMAFAEKLSRPEYRRVVWRHLRIADQPRLFQPFGWGQALYRRGVYAPVDTEFEDGSVHRPPEAEVVLDHLCARGVALVEGPGACGKTTLAQLISRTTPYHLSAAYYADMSELTEATALPGDWTREMLDLDGSGVLFVMDNVHLQWRFVSKLYAGWANDGGTQGHVLLVGRQATGNSRLLPDGITPIPLVALGEAARGVFNRLFRRTSAPAVEAIIPEVPGDAVDDWVRVFGGHSKHAITSVDLMALSAAISNKMADLVAGRWQLRESDARAEVRRAYLDPATAGERQNLLRLACLPHEFRLSERALAAPEAGFVHSLANGLIFESTHGGEQHRLYRFAHPALARLIWTASPEKPDLDEQLAEVATADPFAGLTLARRLYLKGDAAAAERLARLALASDAWLGRYTGHLGHLRAALKFLHDIGASDAALLIDRLGPGKALLALVERSPLQDIGGFLTDRFTMGLPIMRSSVAEAVRTNSAAILQNRGRVDLILLSSCLRSMTAPAMLRARDALFGSFANDVNLTSEAIRGSSVIGVLKFIEYLDAAQAPSVTPTVSAELSRYDYAARLATENLEVLTKALEVLDKPMLRQSRSQLIKDLLQNKPTLHAVFARSDIQALVRFLRCRSPDGMTSLRAELASWIGKNVEVVVSEIATSPFDRITAFLDCLVGEYFGDLRPVIVSRLLEPHVMAGLAANACREDLIAFAGLLRFEDLGRPLIELIDAEEWRRSRTSAWADHPQHFGRIARLLDRFGRFDLAEPIATNLLRGRRGRSWDPKVIDLNSLAAILRVGKASPDEMEALVSEVATPQSIRWQYAHAPLGRLSGALFWLAFGLEPELAGRLADTSLVARLQQELAKCDASQVESCAAIISCLGAYAALGGDLRLVRIPPATQFPTVSDLLAVLGTPSSQSATARELQLWHGIYALNCICPGSLSVPHDIAARALERIEATEAAAPATVADVRQWLSLATERSSEH